MFNDTVSEERIPSLSSGLPVLRPGVSRSTTKALMPRLPFDGSVTARTTNVPARAPFVTNCFAPFSTHASPSLTARVFMAAASVPDPGSLRHQLPIRSPDASAGSQRFFCSDVAAIRMC